MVFLVHILSLSCWRGFWSENECRFKSHWELTSYFWSALSTNVHKCHCEKITSEIENFRNSCKKWIILNNSLVSPRETRLLSVASFSDIVGQSTFTWISGKLISHLGITGKVDWTLFIALIIFSMPIESSADLWVVRYLVSVASLSFGVV